MNRKRKPIYYFWAVFALILGILVFIPIIIAFLTSLKPQTEVFSMRLLPKEPTFEGYVEIFTEFNFGRNIKNSLIVAVITTFLSLFMQSTSAYAFARLRFRGKSFFFIVVLSTMMIPFSVIMIPLFIIVRDLHLTNSLAGIIIPIAANGYGVYLLRQFFFTIPRDLDESACIDGASHFQIFYRILLPLCKPILMTLGFSYFIFNWNNYLWPLIVTTNEELNLIQQGIASFRQERQTLWNLIFAASTVASVPVLLLFTYFQKFIVEGIKTSGVKG